MNRYPERPLDKILPRITLDTEVVGILGEGYPTSFYRVHVQVDGHWYGIEIGAAETKRQGDLAHPVHYAFSLGAGARALVWGKLRDIAEGYSTIEREGLVRLMAHARQLLARERATSKPSGLTASAVT